MEASLDKSMASPAVADAGDAVRGDFYALQDTPHVPRGASTLLRTLLFSSADPIYALSKQRALGFDDLFPLREQDATVACYTLFKQAYERHGRSIAKAMVAVYAKTFVLCGLGYLFVAANAVFAPVVVHHVVSAFSSEQNVDATNLSVWLSTFVCLRVANVVVATQVENAINHMAMRLTAAMKSLLFRKALRRDTVRATSHEAASPDQKKASAEISNLISSDTNGVLYAMLAAHSAWILPLQIVIITILLYRELDVAAFAGIGVVVASLSVNYGIARVMGDAYGKLMHAKDTRMKTVKEVFSAIQIVKFNAWEPRFHAQLTAQRAVEVKRLSVYSYASAASMFVLWSSPFFVSTVSFAVYAVAMDRPLTAAKVFTSMALFNALRDPLRDLPATIQSLIQSRVSIQRLDSFLASPELDPKLGSVRRNDPNAPAIRIENATFAWGHTVVLQGVALSIQRGEFVVVDGSVGAGKSSLLSGLLGEMTTISGRAELNGSVAYYSQQPWIQNMTIRDNILFGTPFHAAKYAAVLDACCLGDDLALLDAGDATEIGEKGVNLSGGQRARVALARACYADSDIYLLDAPLAAVDAVVQLQLFEKCLCGLLQGKTVVLVTHNPDILASSVVDCRVTVATGQIASVQRATLAATERRVQRDLQVDEPSVQNLEFGTNATAMGVLVQEEERQQGQIASSVLRQYLQAIGGGRLVVLLLVAQLAWQGFQIGSDVWLSHWTSTDLDPLRVPFFTSVYASLAVAGALMVLVRGILVAVMGLNAAKSLFQAMTTGLLHAPIRFFDANPIGRIINRYSDDIATIDVLVPTACSTLLSAFFSTVGALTTTAVTIKFVGLCVVPLIAIYVRIARGYVRTFCDVRRMLKVVNSPILCHITQSEAGATLLRAFGDGYVARAIAENHRRIDVDNALWDTEIVLLQWFALRLQLLGCGVVLVVVGSFIAFSDWFSPGMVGLAFTYALSIDASLLTLLKAWAKAENAMVSVERVVEYGALPLEGGDERASMLTVEPPSSWPEHGSIQFESVSFAYKPGDSAVLHDMSLSIRPREKVGIVGRTGAGKSSLSMALLRMNELASGRILIDGVDVAAVPLAVLRSRIAIIPQSPVLLEGSLRHFLDPFDDYSDADLTEMLAKVELLSTLQAIMADDVLAMPLHANGENLSVGERQLLCVARALLRRCSIVVMDEATAAMDHTTETKLARMIQRELSHVTQLTIAHRLATVAYCDRVLVLDQGRVVEFDAPATLLRDSNGAFRALVDAVSSTNTCFRDSRFTSSAQEEGTGRS